MKRKIPLLLLCLLFLSMVFYAGFQMLAVWREYRAGEQTYEALAEFVQIPETTASAPRETSGETLPSQPPLQTEPTASQMVWPTVDFEALQTINPDVVAWIYLEGTPINYPVVRGDDNSQYLDRMFDGTYNSAGSIFMDYRNESDLSDRHTVLYGHHMNNGTMFGFVSEYVSRDLSKEYPNCLILTPTGNYKLEFFAGYVDDPNTDAWQLEFGSDEEYSRWLEQSTERSAFAGEITPTAQDRIVTLSTCSYEFSDARCVLLGVLKPAHDEILAE